MTQVANEPGRRWTDVVRWILFFPVAVLAVMLLNFLRRTYIPESPIDISETTFGVATAEWIGMFLTAVIFVMVAASIAPSHHGIVAIIMATAVCTTLLICTLILYKAFWWYSYISIACGLAGAICGAKAIRSDGPLTN